MKKKLTFGWIIAIAISSLIGWIGYYMGSRLGERDGTWMAPLLGYLSMGFFIEAIKTIKGEKPFWSYLGMRDKVVFTISTIILFVFFLIPIKEGEDSEIRLIYSLAGITLAYLNIYFFATEEGKDRLFFPNGK